MNKPNESKDTPATAKWRVYAFTAVMCCVLAAMIAPTAHDMYREAAAQRAYADSPQGIVYAAERRADDAAEVAEQAVETARLDKMIAAQDLAACQCDDPTAPPVHPDAAERARQATLANQTLGQLSDLKARAR